MGVGVSFQEQNRQGVETQTVLDLEDRRVILWLGGISRRLEQI
jgi:hypothetical protein